MLGCGPVGESLLGCVRVVVLVVFAVLVRVVVLVSVVVLALAFILECEFTRINLACEELLAEVMRELRFERKGKRIEEAIERAIAAERSRGP